MMLRGCLAVALTLSFLASPQATQAQSQISQFGKASAAYSAKEYSQAESLLTELVEANSTDPRVYYFRGLTRFALGRSDDARPDFEEGARLEASGAARANVSRSLERVQGPARAMLEKYRGEAKRAASLSSNSSRRAKTLYSMYSAGRTAYFAGELADAQKVLDEVVKQGSADPRAYYFRGLTLHGLGRIDEAKADFAQAVTLELNPNSRIDVSRALERVQGPARKALESHREEKMHVARAAQQQRRREMIAQLAARQPGGGLIATSVLPRINNGGKPTGPAVASTTPSATNPGTGTTSPPPATTTPATPTAPRAPGAALDLAYLPPNAALVVQVKVREIWQSTLVRPLHDEENVKMALAQMKQMTGLNPADIESVTAATTEIADEVMAGPIGIAQGTADDDLVVVIRTRLPFDVSILQNLPMFETAMYDGKEYFKPTQATIDSGEDLPSVFRAESKVLVLAMDPALHKAIDQGPDFTPRPEFDFVDGSKQIVIGYVPDDAAALTEMLPDPAQDSSGSPSLDKLVTTAKGNLLGFSLGVGVDDYIELAFSFLCTDDAVSAEMNTAFAGLLDEGKGMLSLTRAAMPPQIGGLADSLLRSIRSNSRGGTFTFSTKITQQTINRAIAAVGEIGSDALMGLAMGAGGPGGPGIPGAGPGSVISSSKPIEPPKATAQAENLTVAGTAKVSSTVDFDFDTNKELPRAIELLVDITGAQAKKASGFGFVTLTSAKDENGTDLKLRKQQIDPFGGGGFESIDREDFFVEHPEEGCRVTVKIEPPAQAPTKITAAEGTVKLRIIDSATQITVDDAKSLIGKAVGNAELTKEGYALKLEEGEEKFGDITVKQWKLTWTNASPDPKIIEEHGAGGGKGLQNPQIVDADGNVIYSFDGTEYGTGGGESSFAWSMAIQEDTPIPDGAKLRFSINKEISIVDVPFKLADVTIGKSDF
jgi:tetratricopeptide (TPR) repeat protein